MFADLLVTRAALSTSPASEHEGHGDAVANLPLRYFSADRADHAGQFVSGNVWQADAGIVADPAVPVAAADAARLDLHDDARRFQDGIGHGGHPQGSAERFVQHSFHGQTFIATMPGLANTWATLSWWRSSGQSGQSLNLRSIHAGESLGIAARISASCGTFSNWSSDRRRQSRAWKRYLRDGKR